MVNTRTGGGQDIPSTRRARVAQQQASAPAPTPAARMDPNLVNLIANLTNVVQNMQHQQQQQMNMPPPPPPGGPRDKYRDFMSLHPLAFSQSAEPLDVDDWLMTVDKKLDLVHCGDHERVLYTSSKLEGTAADWWDAYLTAHANPDAITWVEFRNSFRTRFIPSGIMKQKLKEFLELKQGSLSVAEYRDRFTQLSRYAPNEVDTDEKQQERFLGGLIGPLKYQLQCHSFPSLETMFNMALGLEVTRRELGEHKRKLMSQGQSSNTRPRFNPGQNSQFRPNNSGGNFQRFPQQIQRAAPAPRQMQNGQFQRPPQQNRPNNAPPRANNPVNPAQPRVCYRCGEAGHFAASCPKRNPQAP